MQKKVDLKTSNYGLYFEIMSTPHTNTLRIRILKGSILDPGLPKGPDPSKTFLCIITLKKDVMLFFSGSDLDQILS